MDGSAVTLPGSRVKLRRARRSVPQDRRRLAFRARLGPELAASIPASPGLAWRTLLGFEPLAVHARSRTTETVTVAVTGLGRVVRKRWTWPRRRDRLKGALRTTWAARSPARREFEALARLRGLEDGPFAPEPLGYLEHREHGVLRACVLVTREVAGAEDLARWLVGAPPGRAREEILVRLAERVRAMHDAGLADLEMHPRNVLVVPSTGDVLKVDCAKQRRRAGRDARARDLAALDVGLVRLARPAEREAFFRAYGPDPRLRALVERERLRIDARESRRLPGGD